MRVFPDGVSYAVLTKQDGVLRLESHWDADVTADVGETNAQESARAAFESLYGAHVGPEKQYVLVKMVEMATEVRPV
jgi:hypothetical protein